jgi:hypothetical protein
MFGKAFLTRKEAQAFLQKQIKKGLRVEIRKMSKKIHPRRKKLYHVGSEIDFLNFAYGGFEMCKEIVYDEDGAFEFVDLTPTMTPEEVKGQHSGCCLDLVSACEETTYYVHTIVNGLWSCDHTKYDMTASLAKVNEFFSAGIRSRSVDASTGKVILDMQP